MKNQKMYKIDYNKYGNKRIVLTSEPKNEKHT